MKFRSALLLLAFCSFAGAVSAQNFSSGVRDKFEISPVVGYETSASFPNVNTPLVDRIRVNDAISYGVFLDYSITENFQFEPFWTHQSTSFSAHDVITNQYNKLFDSNIDHAQFGVIFNFRDADKKLRPYAGGGLGFTRDGNSGGVPDQTHFSYNIGGGVKYFFAKHVGFRGDIRYLPTRENTSPRQFCDIFGNCFTANVRNYLKRGSFTGGLVFRF